MLEEQPVESLRDDPLQDSIDIEAVEALLFGSRDDAMDRSHRTVQFEYREYLIQVHSDGQVLLTDPNDTTE